MCVVSGKYSDTWTIFRQLFKDTPKMVSWKNKMNSISSQTEIMFNGLKMENHSATLQIKKVLGNQIYTYNIKKCKHTQVFLSHTRGASHSRFVMIL